MAKIGTFKRGEDGTFTGSIQTLSFNVKARFIPVGTSSGEKSPDLRVHVGAADIGAAWKRKSKKDRDYYSVRLNDPSFPAPIYAKLVESDGGYALIWSR